MKERRITRNTIQIISRYKGLAPDEVQAMFKDEGIYADEAAWSKFIKILLLSIGVASTLAGTIFFFAYNWNELHKFVKLGLVQFLIISGIAGFFLVKENTLLKNGILTATSILVGLLFSVFGQIYQTGADAYDFFLGWTVFVLLWSIVSKFPLLWLLQILLINITFLLYVSQVASHLSATTTYLVLALIDIAAIGMVKALTHGKEMPVPGWFYKILIVMIVAAFTICMIAGIVNKYQREWFIALPVCLTMYAGSIFYGLRNRSLYLLCLVPFSSIIILIILVYNLFKVQNQFIYLLTGVIIVILISMLVMVLTKLNKAWYGND